MTEAVVAGSRGFALALLAPLTERIGARPRVAADPSQVLALCLGPGGLAVVEFQGEDTLRAIQHLVLQGSGLRIVAAVPAALAAADEPLRALGVQLVRWDGRPDGVLAALSQPPGAPPSGRPRATAPASAAPAPKAAPAAPPATAAAAKPRPAAAVAIAAPARKAEPAAAPRPPAGRPAATAVAATAVAAAIPKPAPPAARPAPTPRPIPTPAPAPAPPPAAATVLAAAPAPAAAGLFDGVGSDFDVDLDAAAPLDAPAPDAGPWPLDAPDAVAAADALGRALLGEAGEPGTAAGVAAAVVASLTNLERAVFAGAPQPVDAEPVRRAAVMRVRAAAAVATAPGPGGAVDAGAVSAFLAEIDALLSDVNALAAAAPAQMQPSLEALRNALVRDAIDFSEAAQRASPVGAPLEAPVAHARATPAARVVSVGSRAGRAIEEAQKRRQRRAFVALAVCVALAAAFHGHRWWIRARLAEGAPTRVGAPVGATVSALPTGKEPALVRTRDGKPFSADELQRLREAELLRGNAVRELSPGAILIVPADRAEAFGAPPRAR